MLLSEFIEKTCFIASREKTAETYKIAEEYYYNSPQFLNNSDFCRWFKRMYKQAGDQIIDNMKSYNLNCQN